MNLLNAVKEEFYFTTYNIDQLISKYLIKRLGVEDIETVNALGLKGRMTFETRLDLLMQIKSVSASEKKKLEIYSKFYQCLMLKKDVLTHTSEDCFRFLRENYPQEDLTHTDKKVGKILTDFVLDVQHIIERISKVPILKITADHDHSRVEKVIDLSTI
ncbi:MAG: hypothetical protein HKN90_04495 [Flavobacteriaceae bacterium]|nr:hypothetical protein [Flavobacteriaceae bacterium]